MLPWTTLYTLFLYILILTHVKGDEQKFGSCTTNYNDTSVKITLDECDITEFDVIFPNGKYVLLYGNMLTEIPPILAKYRGLLDIQVSANLIKVIPKDLIFPKVYSLEIGRNPLELFEADSKNFPDLGYMVMSGSPLGYVPETFSSFKKLAILLMGDCEISSIEVGLPPKLQQLDLSGNKLTSIPLPIYDLSGLGSLDLKGNPLEALELTESQFSFLSNLQTLLLSQTGSASSCKDGQELRELSLKGDNNEVNSVMVCVGEVEVKPTTSPPIRTTSPPSGTTLSPPATTESHNKPSIAPVESQPILSEGKEDIKSPWMPILIIIIAALLLAAIGFIFIFKKRSSKQSHVPILEHSTENGSALGYYAQDESVDGLASLPQLSPRNQVTGSNDSDVLIKSFEDFVQSFPKLNAKSKSKKLVNKSLTITNTQSMNEDQSNSYENHRSSLVANFYNSIYKFEIDASEISDIKCIGAGGFAVVWLVWHREIGHLAAKRLRTDDLSMLSSTEMTSLSREIQLVSMLTHPNIVVFVGVSSDPGDRHFQILFEYMEGGDLRDALVTSTKKEQDNPEEIGSILPRGWDAMKFSIARDVALGLGYMHSFSPPLLHRDLKARNVLLSKSLDVAKLTDFGVSRIRSNNTTSMTSGVGTGRWLAPEIMNGSTKYTESCDIYSFGVVLMELETHDTPFATAMGDNNEPLVEIALLYRIASGVLDPMNEFSKDVSIGNPDIYDLAKRCLSRKPRNRPKADEIAAELQSLIDRISTTEYF